jgi:hypothetical protein
LESNHVRGRKNRWQTIQSGCWRKIENRTDTGGYWHTDYSRPGVGGREWRIFKMRRRKHYQKRQGHRQNYTEIKIEAIQA